ncbi:DHH family phosphoesterase, partial [Methylophaga sp.]|uniref:DHH family phosphoesterase n=1 Tax=Methylophaga sp. TaxID=2024840 RepID=UPI003F695F7B
MAVIDVFNGDADGICSLVQLRLAKPQDSVLVTGIKRDINLLRQVEVEVDDQVTVLDISMQKNHDDLNRLLKAGAKVFYADHHNPGEKIEHPNLSAHVDVTPSVCTALIVDRYLRGAYHLWAITAAFGDNLTSVAQTLASKAGLDAQQVSLLQDLGIYLNYNGYGANLDDLFFHPADLYRECVEFRSPFDFIEQKSHVFETLQSGYKADISSAESEKAFHQTASLSAVILPDKTWARRVSGVFSNQLSNQNPDRAHLILTNKQDGNYLVSIRAPLSRLEGADEVAAMFKTGGGRKG